MSRLRNRSRATWRRFRRMMRLGPTRSGSGVGHPLPQHSLEPLEHRVLLSMAMADPPFAAADPVPAALAAQAAPPTPTLDVDGNGSADALTDGILIARYLFGFTGDNLVRDAVGPGASRTTSAAIVQQLQRLRGLALDVDLSGSAEALSDGVVAVRYLFGFTGTNMTDNAVIANGMRNTPAAILNHLDNFRTPLDTRRLIENVAAGAVRALARMIHPLSGLPRNEADIVNGALQVTAGTFVPAQLGTWLTTAVLAHNWLDQSDTFVIGMSDDDLLQAIDLATQTLAGVFAGGTGVYADGGRVAMYQVNDSGLGVVVPTGLPFDQTVSLLDNTQLITGMQVAREYLNQLPGGGAQADAIVQRLDALLAMMSMRFWFDGVSFQRGHPNTPREDASAEDPARVNRITSEGRLAPVAALARGEISQAEFDRVMDYLFAASQPGAVDVHTVAQLPFFGNALEAWAMTPYLSGELPTRFGQQTLAALGSAWIAQADAEGRPAAGAMNVAVDRAWYEGNEALTGNTFGSFASSPSQDAQNRDRAVLVPPAAGIMAGALGSAEAVNNLAATVVSLLDAGLYHETWGMPNLQPLDQTALGHQTLGSLEIGQMAVALLNRLAGGEYVEQLLRRNPGWLAALDHYRYSVDQPAVYRQAEDTPAGDGAGAQRRDASHLHGAIAGTWRLDQVNQQVTYTITLPQAGHYELDVRYSNDDTGALDTVAILVQGQPAGMFTTVNTRDVQHPDGWNHFTVATVDLGNLAGTTFNLTLRLDTTDGFGVEFDYLHLRLLPW